MSHSSDYTYSLLIYSYFIGLNKTASCSSTYKQAFHPSGWDGADSSRTRWLSGLTFDQTQESIKRFGKTERNHWIKSQRIWKYQVTVNLRNPLQVSKW